MSLQANFEFLFVGKDDNSFLENYSYDLFQDHGAQSGQIFVNLEIQNNPVDAEEIGAALFETMQKVFFEDVNRDPYERFEKSLKSVNQVLNDFKKQKVSAYIGNLNVVIAAVVGDTLYLSQSGDAEAYLIRKRYVSVVSEGLNEGVDNEEDIFVNIASGQVEPGDLVLFSSTRLLRYIGKTDLARSINIRSITETLGEIKDVISTEILGRIGLTGILFQAMSPTQENVAQMGENQHTETILEAADNNIYAEKDSISGSFVTDVAPNETVPSRKKSGGSSAASDFFSKVKYFFRKFTGPGKGKAKLLVALLIIIVALIVVIFVAKARNNEKEEIERLEAVLENVQAQISEAETKGVYDKRTAKEILDKAYADSLEVLNSGLFREKAHVYLERIEETRDKIDNVQRVENPELLVDLSTKRNDINALGFVAVGDHFYVFEYNALYEVILDQVQDPLTIDDEETVIAATGFDDRSVVFLTESGKLIEYNSGTMSFMDTEDGSFHKAVSIDNWKNRVYLLDSEGNQVWRYTYKATRNQFGTGEDYVNSEEVDFAKATDLSIDSSIYILKSDGDITKIYAGDKVEFFINNPPFDTFDNASDIYTGENLDKIFVVDSTNSRIFVYAKDPKTGNANYETQYLFEGLDGEIRDVYVDADSQVMNILTPTRIYKLSL